MEKIEEKVVNPEEVKETSDQQIEEKVQETSVEKEEISPRCLGVDRRSYNPF